MFLTFANVSAQEQNMTRLIKNPSFETGDETGWTLIGKSEEGNDEFCTKELTGIYEMSNKDGKYGMNAYQWWATSLAVSQTVTNVPSGLYELSAVVATWEGRTVTFSGNDVQTTVEGLGDQIGIPVSVTVRIGDEHELTIKCESTGSWWETGHEGETQTFFKFDNVRLICKEQPIVSQIKTLPNDDKTILTPGQWYKHSLSYPGDYWVVGSTAGLEYTTEGDKLASEAQIQKAERQIKIGSRTVYLRTSNKNTTLRLTSANTMSGNTFTAVALNVDGLPKELTFLVKKIELNPDGPGQEGTLKISRYLAGKNYDIIGCSEDFNYNNALMESLWDNYNCGTIRAKLNASDIDYGKLIQGKVRFDTDGLNLIWKKSRIQAENESWTRWDSTAATDGNDYVKKGYRHYDVRIDNAADIDLYILHMDAGDEDKATWSREIHWRQLADAINNASHDKPKLIVGDTNSRWTREDIISCFMNRLSPDFTMGDPWVEFGRNGVYPTTDMDALLDQSDPNDYSRYEIVDKIIYVNPSVANSVQLKPQSFLIERDYTYGFIDGTEDSTALGDHNPTVSRIRYSQSSGIAPLAVSLSELNSNDKTLEDVKGAIANVTLRSFVMQHNNVWRPLCLPFSVADLTGTPFEGAILKELDIAGEYDGRRTGLDGSNLYLFFKDATRIVAGRPYLIKWESGDMTIGPVFNNVSTITTPGKVEAIDATVSMVGNFSPISFDAGDKSVIYLDNEGAPCQPTKRTNVLSCRAYFKLAEGVEPEKIIIGFSDYVDGIESIESAESSDSKLYDLSGRKVGRARKGLYIRNGRLFIVK